MRRLRLPLGVSLALGAAGIGLAATGRPAAPAVRADLAAPLVQEALRSDTALAQVQSLADQVGPRLAGSTGADRALEWGLDAMRSVGLENVHLEPVTVTRWRRGDDSVRLVAPREMNLQALALGGSVPTPAAGIEAEVIEASSFEALAALGAAVQDKIVLFNRPMQRTRSFAGYGDAVGLRGRGAIEAVKLGARAALIRSVGTGNYRLPHTGATRYEADLPKIPYAAIAAEDADLLHRLLEKGPVRVAMKITSAPAGQTRSSNVVGELPGTDPVGEMVLIGAHLDSWDVGAGAIDDAAGCAVVLETARLLKQLKLPLRRTLRVVLFMNEENGLAGARAYALEHADELHRHVAALEADAGSGRPVGFGIDSLAGAPLLRRMVTPLKAIGATDVQLADEAGADLTPLEGRVPLISVNQDMTTYFDWHHTAADTPDKIEPHALQQVVAAFAVVAAGLADSPERLPLKPAPSASAAPSPAP